MGERKKKGGCLEKRFKPGNKAREKGGILVFFSFEREIKGQKTGGVILVPTVEFFNGPFFKGSVFLKGKSFTSSLYKGERREKVSRFVAYILGEHQRGGVEGLKIL